VAFAGVAGLFAAGALLWPPARASDGVYVPNPATSWAVVVGISQYDPPTHPTYGGDGDVAAFHAALNKAGWPDSHILLLTDGAATSSAIRGAINWLVSRSGPSTFSLFHYSGHVLQQNGHDWLWGVDNNFISDSEFGSLLQGLAGHAWIDVSGCEAADFNQGISSALRLFTGSSMANQKSYEEPDWHESVWTGVTVDQGMLQQRGDVDGDGYVSIEDAVRWGQQQAPAITSNQRPYGEQDPYAVGGTGQWFLGPAVAPPPPPGKSKPGGSPPTTNDPCARQSLGLLHCRQ
jgi:hypothetical protein